MGYKDGYDGLIVRVSNKYHDCHTPPHVQSPGSLPLGRSRSPPKKTCRGRRRRAMQTRPAVFRSGEAWRWALRWWSAEKSRVEGSYRRGRSSSVAAHSAAALVSGSALLACSIMDASAVNGRPDLGPVACGRCVSLGAVWCSLRGRPDQPDLGPMGCRRCLHCHAWG
jgi:hypothetical protein